MSTVMHEGDEELASTGDHAVDEALTRLDELSAAVVKDHVAVYESIHSVLQDRLADTEA